MLISYNVYATSGYNGMVCYVHSYVKIIFLILAFGIKNSIASEAIGLLTEIRTFDFFFFAIKNSN